MMDKMKICGLIPVAGLSGRMGDFKPLMMVEGRPVIVHCIDSLLQAGAGPVIVVLGYRGREVASVVRNLYPADRVMLAYNDSYADTDMLASVKIGIRALPLCDAFFLLPGDMPAVDPKTFAAIAGRMSETGALLAFPSVAGQQGHPALISLRLVGKILAFKEEGGLQKLWDQNREATVIAPVDDAGCCIDMDTIEEYNALLVYMDKKDSLQRELPKQGNEVRT
ncbi:MAG: nucleotidyltransferase family protein [Saccharofermentanales bacterium]